MQTQALITIGEKDADAERLQEITENLRDELLALDVEDVTGLRTAEPPPGSRAVDLAVVGSLIVTLKGSAELIQHLVTAVRSWLGRTSVPRTVELTIGDKTLRVANASDDQQNRLIDEFLSVVAQR